MNSLTNDYFALAPKIVILPPISYFMELQLNCINKSLLQKLRALVNRMKVLFLQENARHTW